MQSSAKKAVVKIGMYVTIGIMVAIIVAVFVAKIYYSTDSQRIKRVQADYLSIQMAFESVANENNGFNTFGWDLGDTNGNRERDFFDEGDTNRNGIEDNKEVWTGRKTLEEVWCGRYSLVNPANPSDTSGIKALETAINSKLEERLRISISDDYKITMENDTKDPWGNPYMGKFLTNVSKDRLDHGAIWIYSKGPNEQFCTLSHCAKGTVIIEAPLNNKPGIDDLSLVVYYTYRDGFGEVITDTFGFVQFGR